MGSEYSVHLSEREMQGHVTSLGRGDTDMVTIEVGPEFSPEQDVFKLFVPAEREHEVGDLLYRMAVALGCKRGSAG